MSSSPPVPLNCTLVSQEIHLRTAKSGRTEVCEGILQLVHQLDEVGVHGGVRGILPGRKASFSVVARWGCGGGSRRRVWSFTRLRCGRPLFGAVYGRLPPLSVLAERARNSLSAYTSHNWSYLDGSRKVSSSVHLSSQCHCRVLPEQTRRRGSWRASCRDETRPDACRVLAVAQIMNVLASRP